MMMKLASKWWRGSQTFDEMDVQTMMKGCPNDAAGEVQMIKDSPAGDGGESKW